MSNAFRWNVGLLFCLGVVVTIGVNAWRVIQPYTQPPPRPEFATETKPKPTPKPAPVPANENQEPPTPVPETPKEPAIGMGRVVPDIGLILRDQPSSETGGSTGVGFNSEVAILEESEDGEWLRIRDDSTGASGWVRSANIDRVSP